MKAIKLTEGIYWVGGIDWDLRNFHGYKTQRGSTYNAYLIVDEKITLIDTVKHYLYDEMLERISSVINPADIDYIISNHVEMDHSGGLPKIMKQAKNATLFTSPRGETGLKQHYDYKNWQLEVIKPGVSLDLGRRSLDFILTPMVHWPDNMVTYLPEEKLLFSNDAFGQHYASPERFDDQVPLEIVLEEAKKYYANIVMPYGSQVQRVLENIEKMNLEFDTIAPSHGVIWRKNLAKIIELYKRWSSNQVKKEALIVYDTMWGSTEKIAYALLDFFAAKGIKTTIKNLKVNHISDIIPYVLDAQYICVGSPTLNNNMLPTVASFLTYLKGLSSGGRKAIAFGSYGWSGQSVGQIAGMLEEAKFDVIDQIKLQYVPREEAIKDIKDRLEEVVN